MEESAAGDVGQVARARGVERMGYGALEELIDGHLEDKEMPDYVHALLVMFLGWLLRRLQWGVTGRAAG